MTEKSQNLSPEYIKDRLREIGQLLIELDIERDEKAEEGDVVRVGKIREEKVLLLAEQKELKNNQ